MKTSFKIAVVAIMAFIATSGAFAQEWSKEQKEVWQVVQDSWKVWQVADVPALIAFNHEKYQGWDNQSPLPTGKEKLQKYYQELSKTRKIGVYDIEPVRITVTDNAAVVDYYFSFTATYTAGDKKEVKDISGKAIEFWVKEGGKWLMLGDVTIKQ